MNNCSTTVCARERASSPPTRRPATGRPRSGRPRPARRPGLWLMRASHHPPPRQLHQREASCSPFLTALWPKLCRNLLQCPRSAGRRTSQPVDVVHGELLRVKQELAGMAGQRRLERLRQVVAVDPGHHATLRHLQRAPRPHPSHLTRRPSLLRQRNSCALHAKHFTVAAKQSSSAARKKVNKNVPRGPNWACKQAALPSLRCAKQKAWRAPSWCARRPVALHHGTRRKCKSCLQTTR